MDMRYDTYVIAKPLASLASAARSLHAETHGWAPRFFDRSIFDKPMSHDTEREIEIVREELAVTAPSQDLLLPLLLDIQRRLGHVPKSSIAVIAEHFNLSRADVHGVASFYHDLRDVPRGRHVVQICQAEACQAVGCRALATHAQRALGVALGTTTPDSRIPIEAASCCGNCACGPTIRIGDEIYGRVTATRFDELISALDGAHR